MQVVALLLKAPDSAADWAAVLGLPVTVVGVIVTIWAVLRRPRFKPIVTAVVDTERRIVVNLANEGARPGTVRDVNLLSVDHVSTLEMQIFRWEQTNVPIDGSLVPFVLPAHQSADLVLRPDPEVPLEGLRVRVDYGKGDSGCIKIDHTEGRHFGTTSIPNSA